MRLHCIDTGTPETNDARRPLVVLHGLFGSADNWRSQIKQWQTSRRVIAVDLRNHGRSPHAPGMTYDVMADDVLALLDDLDLKSVDLLGHSMGGKVAMTLARRHPARIARLIVADIAPVAYEHGHDDIFAAMRRVESGAPTSRREAGDLMAEIIDSPAVRQFLATNLARSEEGIMTWRVGLDEIAEDYDAIIAPPGGDTPYAGPALLIRGGASDYVQEAHRGDIEATLSDVRLETLEGAGHWLHAEQPEAFRERAERFLTAS